MIFSPCGKCWQPVTAKVTAAAYANASQYSSFISSFDGAINKPYDLAAGGLSIALVQPPSHREAVPPHLSEAVAKAFKSAERNFSTEDGEDAAAMLYRRSIDVAIREKHPEIKGNLAPRIEKLVTLGLLPPSMKDWSDQIRLIGNDGAHEPEGVTREELVPMRGFTEAFLRYFISIPFEVALRRGEIDEQGNPVRPGAEAVAP